MYTVNSNIFGIKAIKKSIIATVLEKDFITLVYSAEVSFLTFILCFLGRLQISPLRAHKTAELAEREIRVLGLDHCPHLAAEQDVAAHVDLPLRALLLRQALKGFWCGL